MDYLCACYWPQKLSAYSMVLKHLVFHKEGIPVVLCALAEGEEGQDFLEKILEWFYENHIRFCKKNHEEYEPLKRELEKVLKRYSKRLRSGALLFCIGQSFFIWQCGEQEVWIINKRFGKPHYYNIFAEETKRGRLMQGSVEAGVGILLGTKDFLDGVSREEVLTCLSVNELQQDVKVRKRLAELGEVAKRKGEKHPAAMLVVTCMKKY